MGMAVIAGLGFSEGRPDLVFTPMDEDGRNCGKNLTADYPYIYLYSVVSNFQSVANVTNVLSNSVCVSSCPKNYTGFLPCAKTTKNPTCAVNLIDFYSSYACKI